MTAPSPSHVRAVLAGVAALALAAAAASAAPSYGKISVTQFDDLNNSTSVSAVATVDNGTMIVTDANKGDYYLSFGNYAAGFDFPVGVPISSVRQNGRDNTSGGSVYGFRQATSSIGGRPEGDFPQYSVSTFLTGDPTAYVPATGANASQRDGGAEFNINTAVGFFNYNEYLAGFAYNSLGTNGGVNDSLVASPGIALGTQVIQQYTTNATTGVQTPNGRTTVNLTSLGATSQHGILLVNHAKNEDNFALSQANADGTFTVYVRDNGSDAASYEQDPMNFVYLPDTDPNAQALGRIRFDTTRDVTKGDYTVTSPGKGMYLLKIRGQSDDTGTLLIGAAGGLGNDRDNIVTYEWSVADGGWLIESRDMPGGGLQGDATLDEPAFNFAFLSTNVVTAVPEPTTLAALGAIALASRRRRRA